MRRLKMILTDIRPELTLDGEEECYSASLLYKFLDRTRCYSIFFTIIDCDSCIPLYKLCYKRTASYVIERLQIREENLYKTEFLQALDDAITNLHTKNKLRPNSRRID